MSMDRILRENARMADGQPMRIRLHQNDAQSDGCEFHWHEELELYYVIRGGVSFLSGGEQIWLYPGDVGFVNWCEPHRGNRFLDGTQHYIIQISADLLAQETVRLPETSGRTDLLSFFATHGHQLPRVLRGRKELTALLDNAIRTTRNTPPGFELELKATALQILAFIVREACAQSEGTVRGRDAAAAEHLKKILIYLSEHCTEPQAVSLQALSRRFGLSIPYLCRIFRASTNLTLTTYVNELRCARAAALLRDGMPLEDTAAACGFHDYNYFSRLFKKVMGCPPSAYKQQAERHPQ